jgi:hypothetical protein
VITRGGATQRCHRNEQHAANHCAMVVIASIALRFDA